MDEVCFRKISVIFDFVVPCSDIYLLHKEPLPLSNVENPIKDHVSVMSDKMMFKSFAVFVLKSTKK